VGTGWVDERLPGRPRNPLAVASGRRQPGGMTELRVEWRAEFSSAALNRLHAEAFDHGVGDHDWLGQVRAHSLGWACAFDGEDLVGFVNVPWDGRYHAFVMDTAVAEASKRRGIGRALVALAADGARAAGCEWLHVDYDEDYLQSFYVDSCGFVPTPAGLIHLDGA
jgi:GNAT superfamily N-acetyltransferase